MKTPEKLAFNYAANVSESRCLDSIETEEARLGFLAGYKAAQEHAHAALEEAEARIQELRDQLADADKVMPDTCEHILDMEKMVDVNGWISVKDRLPEIGQDVLVIKDGLYGLACREIVERKPLPPPQFNNIEIWEWNYGFEAREGQVTHWQPLPEPPKEEG
jgi:hypothetical protein